MIASLDVPGYTDIVPIGQGGLGDVYRARRTSTGGVVAFKLIRTDADQSSVRRRVEREVAALVQLKGHPYVVQIEEMIDTSYGPIVVMEHAAHGSLADLLKTQGPLSIPECAMTAEQVTIALRDAHARGIIHRDIKPHNLLIGEFGQVKVCDFGIAAMARDTAAHDRTSALSYRYASPEELEDRDDVGPAADIYSLGVTMRHLVSGTVTRTSPAGQAEGWLATVDPADAAAAQSLATLVLGMVSPRPEDRPSVDQILDTCETMSQQLAARRIRAFTMPTTLSAALLQSLDNGRDDVTRERPQRRAPTADPSRAAFPSPVLPATPSPSTPVPTASRGLPRPNQAPTKWW